MCQQSGLASVFQKTVLSSIIFSMSLTLEEVEHIADLARLKLTDREKEKYCLQLSAILDYVAVLQELDTHQISLTSVVASLPGVLRQDLPARPPENIDILENAPQTQRNQFKVPPVLE
ncbi:MAG: Asp-tRNA(Asn)/Glu-tRNA(Gln) amidotransferase subunit GatC [Chloroflexi bacterium]|nr:Asp-tRNA(Asn)/Glu-tRNA(Gln) amidotransferase subunit GatC [Chloroflexota bacterium]